MFAHLLLSFICWYVWYIRGEDKNSSKWTFSLVPSFGVLFKQLLWQAEIEPEVTEYCLFLPAGYFRTIDNTWLNSQGRGMGLQLGALVTLFDAELLWPLQVELVNIGGTDIVDGNHKLTLGLLWSIILHWQVRRLLWDLFLSRNHAHLSSGILKLFWGFGSRK